MLVIIRHLPGVHKENQETLRQDSRLADGNFNTNQEYELFTCKIRGVWFSKM
jgi:hypothetical protein